MNKTLSKFVLDIILTALFILLIYPRETGFSFHEIAGLASGALVGFHMLLNWSWVKNITKNLFKPKVKAKTKYFYVLNAVSLATLAGIIITGIQISTVLFPGGAIASHNTVLIHKWLSYSCLGLLGLHLALHWDFFTRTVPRLFKSPGRPSPSKLALNLGALVLTLALIFTQSGFNSNNYVLSSQPAQEIVSSSMVVPQSPTSSTEDALAASNVSYSTRGNGRKHPSTAVATVPPTTSSSISSTTSTSSSNTSQITGTTAGATATPITLNQYLGNLFCTGCSKHCSLLSPQCSIGVSQAATAQQQYIAIYGAASLK